MWSSSLFSLIKNNLNLESRITLHASGLLLGWGKIDISWNTEHINPGTRILRKWLSPQNRSRKNFLGLASWGLWTETHNFSLLIVFTSHEFSMSSARTLFLPSLPQDLCWEGDKTLPQSPCLDKVDLGNQAADVHPHLEQGTHRARNCTTLLLTLIFRSCLVNTSSCRYTCWPQPSQPQCWWWEASQKSVKHVCYAKQLSSY